MAIPFARSSTPDTVREALVRRRCSLAAPASCRFTVTCRGEDSVFVSDAVHGGLNQRFPSYLNTAEAESIPEISLPFRARSDTGSNFRTTTMLTPR
jgi:hypothetical protein